MGVGFVRTLRFLACGAVVAGVLAGSMNAAASPQPVPSLTPAATERLWSELVRRPRTAALGTAACAPLRAIFYAPTDWLRLTTRLAATPSPCAEYYVSVPPLASDKTQLRVDQAWRIRALGSSFHALAEISVNGWTDWVSSTGNSWFEAGVEARRRMAAAGYDVSAGDTWALNELSSAVRQGTGNARANMRAFLRGLHDGDGVLPTTRGVVFVAGIGQGTTDLSLYQARLQDWYEDAAFWEDLSRYASDWSQEVYGDVRAYAVPGAAREARRDALNEYLRHQAALAAAAPASATTARTFLDGADSPLANAAWRYDAAFGWTDVPVELMQDYVSAQVDALRSAGSSRFGFAWSPKNLAALPTADFNAQTDALLVRLASAIADSANAADAACGLSWCTGELAGAAPNPAWRTFSAWKPSLLSFTTAAQTLTPGTASSALNVELRTSAGTAYAAGLPVAVDLSSSSPTAELAASPSGPWSPTLTTSIASGATSTSFYVRDSASGTSTITAAAAGKVAATQSLTVTAVPPPPPPPSPPPPPGGGGGGGPAPDLTVQASITPAVPSVGSVVTYVAAVRTLGGPASKATLVVQLPAQVAYASSQADRGQGCTGTATLTCELDYLAGDLVATVRIQAVVREPGTLTFIATASSQPADAQPANDSATVVTTVAPPAPLLPPADPPPALRVVGKTPALVRRNGRTAATSVRFRVTEPARIEARLTPLHSTRGIALLPGTTLAGRTSATVRQAITATVSRGGTYLVHVRVASAKVIRGRSYLLRLTAVDGDGNRVALTIRVRA